MSNTATLSTALAAYPWLADAPPRMIAEGLRLIGTREAAGAPDDPVIMGWAREVPVKGYHADAVPWCGLYMAVVAHRAGKAVPAGPLWAQNWRHFGTAAGPAPMLGDVLVFRRPSGGHVGLYVAEDAGAFHVLGGNQGDAVSIVRIARARLVAARRPAYRQAPASVRAQLALARGAASTDEA